jgi:hypothetical protein
VKLGFFFAMARFLFVAAATLLVGAAAETYPLFSWSGAKGTFANYEPKSASELIAAKHHGFKASVVYLHSMSTEQLAGGGNTEAMQKAIGNSDSSIFRPLDTASVDAQELVAPFGGHVLKASEAVTFLKKNPEVFSSEKPSVVLVDLREMEATQELLAQGDAIRAQVEAEFAKGTKGDFLSVLTSTKAGPGRKLLWDDVHNTAAHGSTTAQWEFYPRPTGGVHYLTPNVLLALGATIYMFFIAICGYCCLFALQTPDLFEGDQKKEMDRALGQEGGNK